MNLDMARSFFGWCAIINYGILLLWVVIFAVPHEWLYKLLSRFFRLTIEQFDNVNLAVMTMYKMGIILFNIVPYFALLIVR